MIDTSRNMMYHLSNLNAENERVTYQMSTGKILDKGSEDSLLHDKVIDLEDKLRITEGLMLQLTKTQVMNTSADTSLADMKLSLDDIKADLMKGLNSGMDREDKLALATNLKGIRENMIDLMNTEVDGEFVFSGSDTTKQTLQLDPDFIDNGKINYNGDGFLREVAVQPGSYRERGVTAYDAVFYNYDNYDRIDEKDVPKAWDGVGISGEQVVFEYGDKIIDQYGFEWKMNDLDGNHTKLQKYDHNGIVYSPPVEIDIYATPEKEMKIDLGMGANTDVNGTYSIEINGTTYSSTVTGPDANAIFTDLRTQLIADNYTVDSSLSNDDQFTIRSSDELTIKVSNTDSQYTSGVSNEIESIIAEGRQSTWSFIVPYGSDSETVKFEAKHNYFTELNIVINALEGYATKLDGTKGREITDTKVNEILSNKLGQTSLQFDATNIGHGELGGRNKIFNGAYDKLLLQETHYNILIQETNGADLAKLSMESKALELTYNSLYTTIGKMNNLSLLNFID